jgi:hypothetical protein
MELVDHVRLGRAEASRERDELRRHEALRAEHQHLAAEERFFDRGERRVVERVREVDALRLEAEAGRERSRGEHRSAYFRNSGAKTFGTISGISGQTIIAASTSSIGTSMIIVSFSA